VVEDVGINGEISKRSRMSSALPIDPDYVMNVNHHNNHDPCYNDDVVSSDVRNCSKIDILQATYTLRENTYMDINQYVIINKHKGTVETISRGSVISDEILINIGAINNVIKEDETMLITMQKLKIALNHSVCL
jgi:hypothetical protein